MTRLLSQRLDSASPPAEGPEPRGAFAPETELDAGAKPSRLRRWIERAGLFGFAFFLIKGLLWLAVPALLAYLAQR
jgi:hypothetical protein